MQEQSSYIRAIEATAAAVAERIAPPTQVNMSSKDISVNTGRAGGGSAAATGQQSALWEQQQERHQFEAAPAAYSVAGHPRGPVHQVCAPFSHTDMSKVNKQRLSTCSA